MTLGTLPINDSLDNTGKPNLIGFLSRFVNIDE